MRKIASHILLATALKYNPYAGQPAAGAAGAKLYRRHCASCHGEQAQGVASAPALRPSKASEESLFRTLRNGVLERGMPSWSNLPEQQRWQIITYLKSLD